MDAHTDAAGLRTIAAVGTLHTESETGPAGLASVPIAYDVAVNAESRSFWDGDDLVSILSVHTVVCPLIRAELRGEMGVRLLVYYHASTRLGLQAYEAVLRDGDAVRGRLGLRHFVLHTLKLPDTRAYLGDPGIREMYLHEIIRHLSQPIAAGRMESTDDFVVARII